MPAETVQDDDVVGLVGHCLPYIPRPRHLHHRAHRGRILLAPRLLPAQGAGACAPTSHGARHRAYHHTTGPPPVQPLLPTDGEVRGPRPPPAWYHVANWAPVPGPPRWLAWDVLLGLWTAGDLLVVSGSLPTSPVSPRRCSPYRVLYVHLTGLQMSSQSWGAVHGKEKGRVAPQDQDAPGGGGAVAPSMASSREPSCHPPMVVGTEQRVEGAGENVVAGGRQLTKRAGRGLGGEQGESYPSDREVVSPRDEPVADSHSVCVEGRATSRVGRVRVGMVGGEGEC